MTDQEMADALVAAGWRVKPPLTEATCEHPPHMKTGSGSVGSDGSGHMSWTCRQCGKSESYTTPADPKRAQQQFHVWS